MCQYICKPLFNKIIPLKNCMSILVCTFLFLTCFVLIAPPELFAKLFILLSFT